MPKVYIPGETKEQRKERKRKEKAKQSVPSTPRKVVTNTPAKPLPPSLQSLKTNPLPTRKVAFVLGNGTSRASINPAELVEHGTIYGCNALYRSFAPDYLVAVDTKMIREITDAGYHLKNQVWTNSNRYTKDIYGLNLFNPNLGWSSGPTALNFASHNGAERIYILGFDYQGLGRKNELVNNIYSGTENYKNVNDRATYFGNWQRQTSMVIKRNPRKRYIRVVETEDYFVPDNLVGLENLEHITVEKFKKTFKIS